MSGSRKRRVVGVLLLGACAVLGLLAARWRVVATRYWVARMESQDRDSLLANDILLAAPESPSGQALEEYVESSAGWSRLLRSYLFVAGIHDELLGLAPNGQSVGVFIWMDERRVCVTQVLDKSRVTLDSFVSVERLPVTPLSGRAASRLQDLLLDADMDRVPVPDTPVFTGIQIFPTSLPADLVVSMVGCGAMDEHCRRNFGSVLGCGAPIAFLFERKGSELFPAGGGSLGIRVRD